MTKQEYRDKIKAKGFDKLPKGMSIKDALGEKGDKYLKDRAYDEYVTRGRLDPEEQEIFDILNG